MPQINPKVNAAMLRNMTDNELYNFFESTSDPVLKELCERLNNANTNLDYIKNQLEQVIENFY